MWKNKKKQIPGEEYASSKNVSDDQKRLNSLRKRKQEFKRNEQILRDALAATDTKPNNKIIFDDDFENETSPKKKKTFDLFDNDEEDADFNDDFEIKDKTEEKLSKLKSGVRDERFAFTNERFVDGEDTKEEEITEEVENGETDEKNWQLGILGEVLGKSIKPRDTQHVEAKKTGGMIRYDPTSDKHREFESNPPKPEQKKKKKKAKAEAQESEETVPVSNDIFYAVSETLTSTLKGNEEFSLLKSLGRENLPAEKKLNDEYKECVEIQQKPGFNFDKNNPFKYDSSEDEEEEEGKPSRSLHKEVVKIESKIPENTGNLFFKLNDPRLFQCEEFFAKIVEVKEEFEKKRYELKQVVRAKIRNNLSNSAHRKKRKVSNVKKGKVFKK